MERFIAYHQYFTNAELQIINAAVPLEIQEAFENANADIGRWNPSGTAFEHPLVSENNADHINEGLALIRGYEYLSPHLAQELNTFEVKCMYVLHDLDEIALGFDLPMLDPLREQKKGQQIKAIGPHLAKKNIIQKYFHPDYVTEALTLYERFLQQNPQDKEALFARYIDKNQGNRFGCAFVFPYQELGLTEPEPARRHHIIKSLDSVLHPAMALYPLLTTKAQREFQTLVEHDIQRFADIGFQQEASNAYHHWITVLNHQAESANFVAIR